METIKVLTAREVASVCNVTPGTVTAWINAGKLGEGAYQSKSGTMGSTWRIPVRVARRACRHAGIGVPDAWKTKRRRKTPKAAAHKNPLPMDTAVDTAPAPPTKAGQDGPRKAGVAPVQGVLLELPQLPIRARYLVTCSVGTMDRTIAASKASGYGVGEILEEALRVYLVDLGFKE